MGEEGLVLVPSYQDLGFRNPLLVWFMNRTGDGEPQREK